jgi:hypothetical protein
MIESNVTTKMAAPEVGNAVPKSLTVNKNGPVLFTNNSLAWSGLKDTKNFKPADLPVVTITFYARPGYEFAAAPTFSPGGIATGATATVSQNLDSKLVLTVNYSGLPQTVTLVNDWVTTVTGITTGGIEHGKVKGSATATATAQVKVLDNGTGNSSFIWDNDSVPFNYGTNSAKARAIVTLVPTANYTFADYAALTSTEIRDRLVAMFTVGGYTPAVSTVSGSSYISGNNLRFAATYDIDKTNVTATINTALIGDISTALSAGSTIDVATLSWGAIDTTGLNFTASAPAIVATTSSNPSSLAEDDVVTVTIVLTAATGYKFNLDGSAINTAQASLVTATNIAASKAKAALITPNPATGDVGVLTITFTLTVDS